VAECKLPGPEGSIECPSIYYEVELPEGAEAGLITDRPRHGPVTFHKRIDKTTPLLFKAQCRNERVTRAEFQFFRPNPAGTGTEQDFYTVVLGRGYISSIKQVSEDPMMTGGRPVPMMEEGSMDYRQITCTYEPDGVTHTESWR
jgi:type VI secretion system secreted protein Hcp